MGYQENLEWLADANPEAIVMHEYGDAMIGTASNAHGNTVAVYDYNQMAQILMVGDMMSHEEAIEWLEYNTIRAIGYMGEHQPIVVYPFN